MTTGLSSTGVENTFGIRGRRARGEKGRDVVVRGIHIEEPLEQSTKHKDAEGEGTWIYSFADLIMNLLMFFVMMFAISSIDKNKLAQIQEAFSSVSKPEQVQKKQEDESVATDSQKEAMSNAEIFSAVQNLLSQVDDRYLQTPQQKAEAVTLNDQVKKLAKAVNAEWRDQPELQGFEIVLPSKKMFQNWKINAKGSAVLKQLSQQLLKHKNPIKVSISSFAPPNLKDADAYALTTRRAGIVALELKRLLASKKIDVTAVGEGGTTSRYGNTPLVGTDPISIRVSPSPKTNGGSK